MGLGLSGLLLSACNGPASSISPLGATPARSQTVIPLSGTATPTPIPFKFTTVNNPNSEVNHVTGINQLGKIVGWFGGGSGSTIPESYTSEPPYVKFRGEDYPGAQGTAAIALTSNKIVVGYVLNPQNLNGIWGFVRAKGVWSLLKDRKEGDGNYAVTELLGMNDAGDAVGFYMDEYGTSIPFVLNTVTEQYTNLKPPGAVGAEATGIDGKGDIAGTETLSGGNTTGFYLKTGTYYQFNYPGAQSTQALSLNWQDQVVGDYTDKNGATHGFVLTSPTNGQQTRIWQSVDEPNAAGATVITGINNHDDICGWYVDANGNTDGFVASP